VRYWILAVVVLVLLSCTRGGPWQVGGVYAVRASAFEDGYRVLKVVSLDDDAGCALVYETTYESVPSSTADRGPQVRRLSAELLRDEQAIQELEPHPVGHEPVSEAEVARCTAERSERDDAVRHALLAGPSGRDEATGIDFAGGRPLALPEDLELGFERTPCFGTCPVYAISVDATGLVTYEGRAHVAVEGRQTLQLDRVTLDALVTAYAAARLADRPENETRCRLEATDMPTLIFTVRANGRTKRVSRYRGCIGAPDTETLDGLGALGDELTGTGRWVRARGEP